MRMAEAAAGKKERRRKEKEEGGSRDYSVNYRHVT